MAPATTASTSISSMRSFHTRLSSFLPNNNNNNNTKTTSRSKTAASKAAAAQSPTWPHSNSRNSQSLQSIAQAGWVFEPTSSEPDRTRCFICDSVFSGWEPGSDDPLSSKIHASDCNWALISRATEQAEKLRDEAIGKDVIETEGLDWGPENAWFPKSKEMEAARFETLKKGNGWPHDGKKGWAGVSSKKIAAAGWHATPEFDISPPSKGKGGDEEADDTVTCAYCTTTLGGWEKGDDPIHEHRRRAPNCLFFTAVLHSTSASSGSAKPNSTATNAGGKGKATGAKGRGRSKKNVVEEVEEEEKEEVQPEVMAQEKEEEEEKVESLPQFESQPLPKRSSRSVSASASASAAPPPSMTSSRPPLSRAASTSSRTGRAGAGKGRAVSGSSAVGDGGKGKGRKGKKNATEEQEEVDEEEQQQTPAPAPDPEPEPVAAAPEPEPEVESQPLPRPTRGTRAPSRQPSVSRRPATRRAVSAQSKVGDDHENDEIVPTETGVPVDNKNGAKVQEEERVQAGSMSADEMPPPGKAKRGKGKIAAAKEKKGKKGKGKKKVTETDDEQEPEPEPEEQEVAQVAENAPEQEPEDEDVEPQPPPEPKGKGKGLSKSKAQKDLASLQDAPPQPAQTRGRTRKASTAASTAPPVSRSTRATKKDVPEKPEQETEDADYEDEKVQPNGVGEVERYDMELDEELAQSKIEDASQTARRTRKASTSSYAPATKTRRGKGTNRSQPKTDAESAIEDGGGEGEVNGDVDMLGPEEAQEPISKNSKPARRTRKASNASTTAGSRTTRSRKNEPPGELENLDAEYEVELAPAETEPKLPSRKPRSRKASDASTRSGRSTKNTGWKKRSQKEEESATETMDDQETGALSEAIPSTSSQFQSEEDANMQPAEDVNVELQPDLTTIKKPKGRSKKAPVSIKKPKSKDKATINVDMEVDGQGRVIESELQGEPAEEAPPTVKAKKTKKKKPISKSKKGKDIARDEPDEQRPVEDEVQSMGGPFVEETGDHHRRIRVLAPGENMFAGFSGEALPRHLADVKIPLGFPSPAKSMRGAGVQMDEEMAEDQPEVPHPLPEFGKPIEALTEEELGMNGLDWWEQQLVDSCHEVEEYLNGVMESYDQKVEDTLARLMKLNVSEKKRNGLSSPRKGG